MLAGPAAAAAAAAAAAVGFDCTCTASDSHAQLSAPVQEQLNHIITTWVSSLQLSTNYNSTLYRLWPLQENSIF
jgi:hypothetical protein